MQVVVYGKPRCPNCDIAKTILKSKSLPFTYKDISVNADDLLFLKNLGASLFLQCLSKVN